ncbi:hypothetical protein [Antribacter gilvus]|uniref:hypothetical protein n=1 Tax=Antribacter gilvus TaxID=2304675 RepID=UPI000F79B85C|nr:hypothetical protein [Antribacter gilvus]
MNENQTPDGAREDPQRTEQLPVTPPTETLQIVPPPADPSVTERLAALSGRSADTSAADEKAESGPTTGNAANDKATNETAADETAPVADDVRDEPVPSAFDEPVREHQRTGAAGPADQRTGPSGAADPGPAVPAVPGTPVPPATAPAVPVPARPTGTRVGTVVWGFVVVAFGLGLLATVAGFRIDFGIAAIVLLGVAGVALVVGSILTSLRRRK